MKTVLIRRAQQHLQALKAFFMRSYGRSAADMARDNVPREDFGCKRCWPSSAKAAWKARGKLTHVVDLVDESHFHVMILTCPACAQRFVSVFTETVDWEDGDDPQYWQLLPITEAEAASLIRQQDALSETTRPLHALGPGRRSLWRDHPKAAAPCTFWGTGISVRLHD